MEELIQFLNLMERERTARAFIQTERARLNKKFEEGRASETERRELTRLNLLSQALKRGGYADPLFASVRFNFAGGDGGLSAEPFEHDQDGVIVFPTVVATSTDTKDTVTVAATGESEGTTSSAEAAASATPADKLARVALVLGYLELDAAPLPKLVSKDGKQPIVPDQSDPNWPAFSRAFYDALGEARASHSLAVKVLPILASEGDLPNDDRRPVVSTVEYARVMRTLVKRGVNASEPQLRRRVNESLDRVQNVGDDRPMHEIGIVLPDLEEATDYEIIADNIRLMGPMIFASMFEELKAFQAVDKILEMFQRGVLPIGRGAAGTRLYRYWREAPNRMSEAERQTFYAMTLGVPGGSIDGIANAEFNDLWMRFVSSVSSLIREDRVDRLIRASNPASINQQQVRKAARDLAANLSLHGYGMSYYAALDFQQQINEMIELLSYPEIKSAFGARDMWQVIDQVAQLELGGARNSAKYRTLATCGAIITTWLANHTDRFKSQTKVVIDLEEVRNPPVRPSGETATSHPNDYDLVNACELWLADVAASDDRVEEMSQPRESPQQTSRPIQIPSVARDLLDQAGIGLGMSAEPYRQSAPVNGYGSY